MEESTKAETPVLTRKETARSLEDAEKYKALNTLSELGLTKPFNQFRTFHGRVGQKGEGWAVDRKFDNQGNATGNANVNERPTLYTSDEDIAKSFARARGSEVVETHYYNSLNDRVKNYSPEQRQQWLARLNQREQDAWNSLTPQQKEHAVKSGRIGPTIHDENILSDKLSIWPEARRLETTLSEAEKKLLWAQASQLFQAEVHEILSSDPDASIIDLKFDYKSLGEEDQQKYFKALEAIAIRITEGSPVEFTERDSTETFIKAINQKPRISYILSREIPEIASSAGISEKTTMQLASAFNSRLIAIRKPTYLADRLLRYPSDIFTDNVQVEGQEENVPFNLEYAQRYLRQAHIIGAKQTVDSATLGEEIGAVSFFDLEKIGTRDQISSQREEMEKKMIGLVEPLEATSVFEPDTEAKELIGILNDAHAKPESLIDAAKKIAGYRQIFEADAGNWEGFTLEEHTETVLRNFEENFADILPVEYIRPMRLAILSHDLGKPRAAANGEKHEQEIYNRAQAKDFLRRVGLASRQIEFISAVTGEGSSLAFKCQRQPGSPEAFEQMRDFAKKSLQGFLASPEVSDSQITAFTEMCRIFQTCDGGAYTNMAITRRNGTGRFRNAPSFNESFSTPVGLGKRDITYK